MARSVGGPEGRSRIAVAASLLAALGLGLLAVVALVRPSTSAPVVDADDEPAGLSSVETTPDDGSGAAPETLRAPGKAAPRGDRGRIRLRLVRAADHQPVPGIPVALRGPRVEDGPTRAASWSDDRGEVVFERVAPARDYALRIQPGAAPRVDRERVAVEAGETTDLGDFVLESLGALDALVVTADGAPIPGARIATSIEPETLASLDVDPWPLPSDLPIPGPIGTTDNLGRARLDGLPSGLVAVRATAVGYRGATDRALVPSAAPAGAMTFVLVASPGLSGVVREAGKPAAGLVVRVGVDRIDQFDARASTTTDVDGRFAIDGLGALRYVDVEIPRGKDSALVMRRVEAYGLLTIDLPVDGTLVVRVEDRATHQPVAGARVVQPTVRSVVKPGERAPERVDPRAKRRRHEDERHENERVVAPQAVVTGVTDAGGRATLEVGPGAAIAVEVRHPRYLTYGPDELALRDRGPLGEGAVLGPEEALLPRELREVKVLLGSVARMHGSVYDKRVGRSPFAVGARVRVEFPFGRPSVEATTDDKGKCEFVGAPPDRVLRIVATSSDGRVRGQARRDSPGKFKGGSHFWWDDFSIDLATAPTIVGRVVDVNGAPVEGATVSVRGSDRLAATGRDGTFRLAGVFGGEEDPLVSATAPGYPPGRVLAVLAGARDDSAEGGPAVRVGDIVLGAPGDIHGFVQDSGRRRVRFPVIEVATPGVASVTLRIVGADENGEFVARSLPPGPYVVRARGIGVAGSAQAIVDVSGDPSREVPFTPIVVAPTRTITGIVLDREGDPVADVQVLLHSQRQDRVRRLELGPDVESTQTDDDGRFVFATGNTPSHVLVDCDQGRASENVRSGGGDLELRLR